MKALYENDFNAWLLEQASALRARNFECLDVDNVAEELEGMARSDRRELKSRLHTLLFHLLKWRILPKQHRTYGRGWRLTISEQRHEIEGLLKDSPSLRFYLPELFIDAWLWACKDMQLTYKDTPPLPPLCPWDFEQLLVEDFLPEK